MRRMMIAVAVIAIGCALVVGLWRRHLSLKRQAEEFAKKARSEMMTAFWIQNFRWPTDGQLRSRDEHFRLDDYYEVLRVKYERAAARPWLPLGADPPPPEWPQGVVRDIDPANAS
jgi:hypothetical protein